MSGTLVTEGRDVSGNVSYFESFDHIVAWANDFTSPVMLTVTSGGKLDLSDELGNINATITAVDSAITLTSGRGDDHLNGSARADRLNGGSGDDVIIGGEGRDALYGGSGDDMFVVSGDDAGTDSFHGGSGTDDRLQTTENAELSHLTLTRASGVEVLDIGAGTRALSGTDGDDYFDISGISRYTPYTAHTIDLNDGNDRFIGSRANDDVVGGAGADVLLGGRGDDLLAGSEGNDRLYGGAHNDVFVVSGSEAGRDAFFGGDGSDDTLRTTDSAELSRLTLDASASVEILDISGGTRALAGTDGNDRFDISGVREYAPALVSDRIISMGDGNDRVIGSKANDNLRGDAGSDRLAGGNGDDLLAGDSGNDTLIGSVGNDTLSGGDGRDALTGGAGQDFFVFEAVAGEDHADDITDFVAADDQIALNHATFSVLGYYVNSDEFLVGSSAQTAEQHLIYNAASGNLYFDVDGNGSDAAVLVASLAAGTTLNYDDFVMTS